MMKRASGWLAGACIGVLAAFPLPATAWDKLEGCRLVPNPSNDGDSFHVLHEGREYIFRLYFVDCPETDDQVPERVSEQADDFGVDAEALHDAGRRAAEFTRSLLAHDFDVYTRWTDALGASRMPRYYAFVRIRNDDLGELLIEEGLARLHGTKVDSPQGADRSTIENRLGRLLARSMKEQNGIWRESRHLAAAEREEATSVRDQLMTRDEIMASLRPPAIEPPPGTLVVSNAVSAYTVEMPYEQVGYFAPGAQLQIVGFIDRAMVQVKFTSPSGKVIDATCKYWELGIPAEEPAM
jgi:endonuclease YncB( thermonuclease family)